MLSGVEVRVLSGAPMRKQTIVGSPEPLHGNIWPVISWSRLRRGITWRPRRLIRPDGGTVDTQALEACVFGRASSNLAPGTNEMLQVSEESEREEELGTAGMVWSLPWV